MWFLLSLNLIHWIGSFSTVGLDSHLGFRQKWLREANHFTFHSEEKKREEEQRVLKRGESGHDFRGSLLKRLRVGTNIEEHLLLYGLHRNRGCVWPAFIAGRIAQKSRVYGLHLLLYGLHRNQGCVLPAFIAVRIAQKSRVCAACIYCCTACTEIEGVRIALIAGTIF